MNPLKKIVIIGPESTGKSTLCKQLADHYKTICVPEFAREYLSKNGTNYTYEDLLIIAKGQVALEEEYMLRIIDEKSGVREQKSEVRSQKSKVEDLQSSIINHQSSIINHHSLFTIHHSPFFIDTDMYVMKVWCEFVFDKCPNWILDQIAVRKYDMYLLCNTDLPWVKEELREYPKLNTRNKLYNYYKDSMLNQSIPCVDISGNYEQRLQKAVRAVDGLLT